MFDDHRERGTANEVPLTNSQDMELGSALHDGHARDHDLEAHSNDLRRFDEVREQSTNLQSKGKNALVALIKIMNSSSGLEASEYEQVKALRVGLQTNAMSLGDISFDSMFKYVAHLDDLSKTPRSVLIAAESMRALVATNVHTLGPEVMRCWYWIVREFFTVSGPDWSVGSARAGVGGWASGFVTAQCVHAVLELSDSLAATHDFCRHLHTVTITLNLIDQSGIPEEWRETDKDRIASSLKNTLKSLLPRLPFRINDIEGITGKNVKLYVSELYLDYLKLALEKAAEGLLTVGAEINNFRKSEKGECSSQANTSHRRRLFKKCFAESTPGHAIASAATRKARMLVRITIKTLKSDDNLWEALATVFQTASARLRDGLQATRMFLSRTIDEQLTASGLADGRQWEPAELAFAADAFTALTRVEATWDEERIRLAAYRVQRSLAPDGTLVIRSPYHTKEENKVHFFVPSNTALAAAANLLRTAKIPLTESFVRRLLPGLIERSVIRGLNLNGWRIEYSVPADDEDLLETACAVEALVSVTRLLDEGINSIILPHFSVRLPDKKRPGLDDLFYPDYGFAQKLTGADTADVVRSSCAIMFQRLRAHVTQTDLSPLHSLVLYGPAGTGKTTLVEALAQTCDVPMIEVTPSDLAKGGEVALERRARAVFEALSLLTHVVILFDEFDPILHRRDATGQKEFTYFSFLTPGMLPKLKNLSEKANLRSVAYVLITNLLGTLDEAAVRRGRFDERLAVFSPDPLARIGRLAFVVHKRAQADALIALKARQEMTASPEQLSKEAKLLCPTDFLIRLREVAYRTHGLGMPQMTSTGWYRSDGKFGVDTPLGYIFNKGGDTAKFTCHAEAEDPYDSKLRGEGVPAVWEEAQWWWLHEWDIRVSNLSAIGDEQDVLTWRDGKNRRIGKAGRKKTTASK